MLCSITATDVAGAPEKRKLVYLTYIEHLDALEAKGSLVIAGLNTVADSNDQNLAGFTGGLIIVELTSMAAAQALGIGRPMYHRKRLC
ncbi:YciI family protein [Candidatus Pseudomonas adelgestsugas]|uniref:YciI-like protein n=1 Tax=Candidatus Pseudomonas adelgestsugas TaxID=1302376 RepID=A0ABX5RAI1_9PSED|nr:YciI family protein [Candidatus Pseudomonas adelgestsugas]QAX82213.1 YciI-like protein [Candidatus Pseudomonas adelgestsugas]